MTLTGKSILITGASKGIGRELALKVAAEKVTLCLVARSKTELEALKSEVEALGSTCIIIVGNVADSAVVKQAVDALVAINGNIDILVNNAGYGVFGRVETITEEVWTSLYEVNVKGTFLFTKEALPYMRKAKKGHLINIASDVAKRVFDGGSLYCSSKFAQDSFSAAVRKEVRADGIKVSVVYSGLVDTPFHPETFGTEKHDEFLKVQDMANAIHFVMSQPAHVVIDELMIHPLSQDY